MAARWRVAEKDAVAATEEFQAAMAVAEATPTSASEDMAEMDDDGGDDAGAGGSSTGPAVIVTVTSGTFSGVSRYEITGEALVLNNGTDQRFLRFENFESSNGPDLKVYLRAEDGSFVSLGELKGNIGSQNYEIAPDVDLSVFSTVQIWCERFGVEFGSAELA
ncbi:MAG: DM13 domain-containing protein [Acidimicrobiia bacterium]|nr:DM13 domain-containing protein [Acidimicrobiia bacterium]